jgi:tetrapyrrole methylase family protein/MazG family protein
MGTYRLLRAGHPVVLRTAVHPVVDALRQEGIPFSTFDELYETGEDFAQIYEEMARRLIAAAREHHRIVYAVPGHPLMAEQSVQNLFRLAEEAGDVEVEIGAGQSFLDAVCSALKVDPIEGFLLLDGTQLRPNSLQPGLHTFVVQVYSPFVASEVKLSLMEVYPDDYPVTVVRAAGVKELEQIATVPLHELDRVPWVDHLTTVYLPPAAEEAVRYRDPWYLVELVETLRGPDGCPWDRKQTHKSLRKYVIEEAYEVAHAIDEDDPFALCNELGDLLLQVLLHAQIASETGDFSIRDIYQALAGKLIRRHPHVFGGQRASDVAEANQLWAQMKAREGGQTDSPWVIDQVKWGRPPLQVALELQDKAASLGFEWDSVQGVVDKLREETAELEREVAAAEPSQDRQKEELGDLLFTLVNIARWLQVDLEEALVGANQKFAQRIRHVEQKIKENGGDIANYAPSDLEKYWNQAKSSGNSPTNSPS